MLSSYWDTGIYQPTLFGANVLPRAFCSSPPPVHLPTFTCPPSPASPLSSSTPLHVGAPQPQVRSVEETFTRILKKGKEGRGRKRGYDGEKSSQSLQLQIFFLHFFIMTHVYNTKYFDQKQSCCRDTKSTFIAGHKDK